MIYFLDIFNKFSMKQDIFKYQLKKLSLQKS